MATIGRQGMPPSVGKEAPSIVVGDAAEGQAYFAGQVRRLPLRHRRPEGNRQPNRRSQDAAEHVGRGRRAASWTDAAAAAPRSARAVTVTVTLESGENGGRQSGPDRRLSGHCGSCPTEPRGPFAAMAMCLKWKFAIRCRPTGICCAIYTDKDMHDVTAYLVT